MSNRARRKTNKAAYKNKIGYISPAKRKELKEAAGIPTRLLSREERRHWAKLNRYARKTGEDVSEDFKVLAG